MDLPGLFFRGGVGMNQLHNGEFVVLGTIASEWPELLPEMIVKLLRHAPESFDDPRAGRVAVIIRELHQAGQVVCRATVERALNGEAADFVPQLMGAALPLPVAEEEAGDVWEAYMHRRRRMTLLEAAEEISAHPDKSGKIARNAIAALTELENEAAGDGLDRRRFDPSARPEAIRPVYSLAGVPICTPGNLCAITAEAKAGKTGFLSAMMAATMTESGDTLSISSGNPSGLALVHIDTEQSPDDHWHLIDRVLRRAGSPLPVWLHSYCLTGMSAEQAFAAFKRIVQQAARECRGIHSALIDGVADLVRDVNDSGEANSFVAELHDMAIRFDCPIVGVLHWNPGSEKTRGHLGSQLERKAESNLKLKKDGETTVVFSTKQRRAPILEATGPRFRWCQEAGMHVTCSSLGGERRQSMAFDRDEVFSERAAMRFADIVTTAKTALGISERTAARRVKAWCQAGLIVKSMANLWTKQD